MGNPAKHSRPGIYGTKAEMLRIDDWTYDNIPFAGRVYFRNGRVSSQDWPSLPQKKGMEPFFSDDDGIAN